MLSPCCVPILRSLQFFIVCVYSSTEVIKNVFVYRCKSYSDQYLLTYGIDALKTNRRKLRFFVWKEVEPIYDGNLIVQAKCTHYSDIYKLRDS